MAVSRMKLATVVGPLRDIDAVVLECIVGHEFHPESAASIMKTIRGLRPLDPSNPYLDKQRRTERILSLLNVKPDREGAPPESAEMDEERLSALERRIDGLLAERQDRAESAVEDEQLISQLKLLRDIDAPIEGLYNVTYMKFRFGRLPRDVYDHFSPVIRELPDVFFFTTDMQKNYVYGMYMVPRSGSEKVDTLLRSLQFERIRISEKLQGSSEEAEQMARADLAKQRTRIAAITEELSLIANEEGGALCAALRHYRRAAATFSVKRYAVRSEESFYLIGWIPEDRFASFEQGFAQREDVSCLLIDESQGSIGEFAPPSRLKNRSFSRPFEPFITMYGLPSYDEVDPTWLVALTYPLLFGVMFGDIGHAALLLLAGLFMWKIRHMWLGKVLCVCAAGSALFGGVYGSVFGNEELLPGFKLHSSESVFSILSVTVYAGAALLALSILLNILNGARQRDWSKVFYGPASLTGLFMYAGIVFTVLPFIGFGTSPLPFPVPLLMIFLPMVVIFIKGPLGVTGFFEMFETFLSFVTNTLSFLRVGAYAISHASLMGVVYSIARSPDGSHSVAVLIIGNLLVAGLESVLVAIQVLRLEYYEIFGRFFSGGGKEFMSISAEEN